MLKVGDLVQMKSGIQPPHLYGVGTVVKVLISVRIRDLCALPCIGRNRSELGITRLTHWRSSVKVGDLVSYIINRPGFPTKRESSSRTMVKPKYGYGRSGVLFLDGTQNSHTEEQLEVISEVGDLIKLPEGTRNHLACPLVLPFW